MRLSKFNELVLDEFGSEYSKVVLDDMALLELGDKTATQALVAGADPAQVWLALCRANQVPKARWHGLAKAKPTNAE